MSDRTALLAAIRSQPAEDTPRLMYADWLDGQDGRTDLDAATAEFIRLSCPMRVRPFSHQPFAMPRAAYEWLYSRRYLGEISPGADPRSPRVTVVANYRRLVPTLLALHSPVTPGDYSEEERDGRRIHVVLRLVLPLASNPDYHRVRRLTPVNLWFRRGFLEAWRVRHAAARALVAPAIAADQPLAVDLVERKAKYAAIRSLQLAGTGEL